LSLGFGCGSNVKEEIERSVILCETEIFSIDESWLPKQPSLTEPKNQMELPRRLLAQEKEMIEVALKESRGRIFGPKGGCGQVGHPAVHVGIEDSVTENRQESLQDFSGNVRALREVIAPPIQPTHEKEGHERRIGRDQ
jgi:hypothetical protein